MAVQPDPAPQQVRPDRADDRPTGGQRLAAYNSIWQLRVDLWWSIADAARRLSLPTLDLALRDELAEALSRELADVAALENFYAFPGRRLVTKLRELADSSYGEVSRTAEAIGRGLVGDAASPTARGLLAGERPGDNNDGQAVATTTHEDGIGYRVFTQKALDSLSKDAPAAPQ